MLWDHPTPPKPLDLWYKDPATVLRLREILDDPVYKLACATLLAAALPSRANSSTDTERNSLAYSWLAGYRDFQKDLSALSRVPSARGVDPEEWAHITHP